MDWWPDCPLSDTPKGRRIVFVGLCGFLDFLWFCIVFLLFCFFLFFQILLFLLDKCSYCIHMFLTGYILYIYIFYDYEDAVVSFDWTGAGFIAATVALVIPQVRISYLQTGQWELRENQFCNGWILNTCLQCFIRQIISFSWNSSKVIGQWLSEKWFAWYCTCSCLLYTSDAADE